MAATAVLTHKSSVNMGKNTKTAIDSRTGDLLGRRCLWEDFPHSRGLEPTMPGRPRTGFAVAFDLGASGSKVLAGEHVAGVAG